MKGPTPLRIHHVEDDDFLDSNIIIYELPVGEKGKPGDDSVHVFTGHKAELYPAAWSPTAARLAATGGGDNSAFHWRIGQGYWDFDLREELVDDSVHVFAGHEAELYPAACSPTAARLVATGGGDNSAFLWRIGQGHWDFELRGHEDSVCSLPFSSDGQWLASRCLGGLVRIWDTQSGNLKCSLEGPEMLTEWIRWHPKGPLVLAGSADATVWMWNADTGACLNTFSGKGGIAKCGDFTPDGIYLLFLIVHRFVKEPLIISIISPFFFGVSIFLHFSCCIRGELVSTGSDDAILRIWDTKSGENIHVVGGHPYHKEGITDLAISPDSTCALTGSYDGSVCIVNITTGRVIGKLGSRTDSIQCAGFAPSQGPSSSVYRFWMGSKVLTHARLLQPNEE